MPISYHAWREVKNITARDLIRALKRDGWEQESRAGATIAFNKQMHDRSSMSRVVIHFHSGKIYGPKFLKKLLNEIGWSDSDLERLKLIKKR